MRSKVATPTQIKNILFPTDFSTTSDRVLPYAAAFARKTGATLHILTVVPGHVNLAEDDPGAPNMLLQEQFDAAENNMESLAHDPVLQGVPHDTTLRDGLVCSEVCAAITDEHADLVILGTKGASGFEKVFLGSKAEEIFRAATCPVLTVGPSASPVKHAQIRKVLFAADFSTAMSHEFAYAQMIADLFDAEVTVVHATMPCYMQFPAEDWLDEAQRRQIGLVLADTLRKEYEAESGLTYKSPQIEVRYGATPEVIIERAREVGADLIVMGAHHAGRVTSHLPWAIAHTVVAEAPCPVITIRD